jgi:hypothetical protein
MQARQARNDACSEFLDLLIQCSRLRGVNEEIHGVLVAINMVKHLRQPCFSATTVQASDYMENLHCYACGFRVLTGVILTLNSAQKRGRGFRYQTMQRFAPSAGNFCSSR